jgi:hypothetical protein
MQIVVGRNDRLREPPNQEAFRPSRRTICQVLFGWHHARSQPSLDRSHFGQMSSSIKASVSSLASGASIVMARFSSLVFLYRSILYVRDLPMRLGEASFSVSAAHQRCENKLLPMRSKTVASRVERSGIQVVQLLREGCGHTGQTLPLSAPGAASTRSLSGAIRLPIIGVLARGVFAPQ